MRTFILILICVCWFFRPASAQNRTIQGKVVSLSEKAPLVGASVVISHESKGTVTDSAGLFSITIPSGKPTVLVASFIGYSKKQMSVPADFLAAVTFELEADPNHLQEVVILSDGFQQMTRERSTGSFVQIDNKLLNRTVSPDIISRLADVTPGLIFNRAGVTKPGAQSAISIRGINTLFAREDPLVVLDNFPFYGDLASINPNDVESVTILKDAAAASIWGARSGNGVIVITSKQGRLNQKLNISFNSNITTGQRPDLFYLPKMSTSDYIDMEVSLFEKGYYQSQENHDNKIALTPVVELLIAKRDGKLTDSQVLAQIDGYRQKDVRYDMNEYLYRKNLNQQYSLSLNGGTFSHRYFVSAGLDKGLANQVGNSRDRFTLNVNHTYSAFRQKLLLTSGVYYTGTREARNSIEQTDLFTYTGKPLYPYASLVDANGNGLAIPHMYRDNFIDQAGQKGLLDWRYVPLDEIGLSDNKASSMILRLNNSLKYTFNHNLTGEVLYQYGSTKTDRSTRQGKDSWYVRDLVNRFTILNTNGSLTRPVPVGDVLSLSDQSVSSHNLRAKVSYDKDWGRESSLTALVGAEVSQLRTSSHSSRFYGYDDELGTSVVVDHLANFKSFVNPASTNNRIPYSGSITELTDRFVSYFANVAYTHHGKYTASVSARRDQSNLFGVKTNQKGVPLYSAGLSWKVHHEDFYSLPWLPYLNLRGTFGYNGNIDKSISAYTTARYFASNLSGTGLPYASVINPPNPQLRWERTRMINAGLDFKAFTNRLSGSIEFYTKKGLDLISNSTFAPQTGITSFRGNTANTQGKGIDLVLHGVNLNGDFQWGTDYFLSWASDKVTKYLVKPTDVAGEYLIGGGIIPTEGKPLYSVFSYDWAGLDAATGNPQGYLNGEISQNYTEIRSQTSLDQLVYNGTLRPKVFGSVRNTFSYKGISLSVNLSYRIGYVFRRPSVTYNSILNGEGGHGDFIKRWQNPGDEKSTHVPSLPASPNYLRDQFYASSKVLVEKGDHLRFQDVHLSYDLSAAVIRRLPFQSVQFYAYAANLGIVWKKASGDIDPDFTTEPFTPKTFSLGVKANF
ncbi:SusC/RagA family TonB-linked outer membrane protein [Dyadobacter sp. CY312]|uniref:SusC/RagA family TonB-linked outer membrane protein n=1 Tax=Dyadobacter sp. CY312 TaxID=2907303 RepID=UPI001F25D7CB|nr:SusC/RagA family TonB-linked outer membrane protein [Dyadobacter sp. CY312]MCE7044531.1 SusC/RagA family TonB-linked outer membrane protein [Dyadobacter sp. CY312]